MTPRWDDAITNRTGSLLRRQPIIAIMLGNVRDYYSKAKRSRGR